MSSIQFSIDARDPDTSARAGVLRTPHGEIETPVFMPVGTQGSVKSISQEDLHILDAKIILGNTYHLYLRPGMEVMEAAGGLHKFMGWDRPLLTDSGGFQVFSLSALNKVTEDGVEFQSHLDGSRHMFTPESAMDIQRTIGADIVMAFDECTDYPVSHEKASESMEMTLRWAKRCKDRWEETGMPESQALFGIVQGSAYEDLRKDCAARLADLDLPGYAVGGVSVGETKDEMRDATAWSTSMLPEGKPRYLMGVGTPEDILDGVERGIDMFDCVLPTRNARNGALFTSTGRLNIKNSTNRFDFGPIDPDCRGPISGEYSRAYLSHLFRANELSALRLNTLHNLFFMLHFTANLRAAIRAGRFTEFKTSFLERYRAGKATP